MTLEWEYLPQVWAWFQERAVTFRAEVRAAWDAFTVPAVQPVPVAPAPSFTSPTDLADAVASLSVVDLAAPFLSVSALVVAISIGLKLVHRFGASQ